MESNGGYEDYFKIQIGKESDWTCNWCVSGDNHSIMISTDGVNYYESNDSSQNITGWTKGYVYVKSDYARVTDINKPDVIAHLGIYCLEERTSIITPQKYNIKVLPGPYINITSEIVD